MEKLAIIIFIIVFALLIFIKQFIKKKIDRKLMIISFFPILLLLLFVANYDFFKKYFEEIPNYFGVGIAILWVFLAFTFLKHKKDFELLIMVIGFSLQTISVISILVLPKFYPFFSAYLPILLIFIIILLLVGTVLFGLGIFLKIKKFYKEDWGVKRE